MTLQTTAPLEAAPLNASSRSAEWFASLRDENAKHTSPRRGSLELNAPYQRGEVWTVDQQRLLLKSFLLGVPVPAIIINDRFGAGFRHEDGSQDWRYTVIDGKQRITALLAWLDGHLSIPASWIRADLIEETVDTDDGPYVTSDGLTATGRRIIRNDLLVPVAEGKLPTLRQEAELYLLVNRGGNAHTDDDLTTARTITGA